MSTPDMHPDNQEAGLREHEADLDQDVANDLDVAALRSIVQAGIDSGPGLDAAMVFARLGDRYTRTSTPTS